MSRSLSFEFLCSASSSYAELCCRCGMLDDWRRETGREWFPSFCLPRAFCCVSEAPCREKRAGEAERELFFCRAFAIGFSGLLPLH